MDLITLSINRGDGQANAINRNTCPNKYIIKKVIVVGYDNGDKAIRLFDLNDFS